MNIIKDSQPRRHGPDHRKNLWDRVWKDRQGKVVVYQHPSALIIGWAVLSFISLFVPSGLYDSSFVSGLSAAAQPRLIVSSPGFLPKDLTGDGSGFVSSFRTDYGHAPAPQAVFGYEAVRALFAALGLAGASANNRAAVVAEFRNLKRTSGSAIGPYSISGGDPSIAPFVFARIRSGALVPFKFVQLAG